MLTLCQLLEEEAIKYGPRTALLMRRGYRTERWSYQFLQDFSQRLAVYLRSKGLQKGERVLLWSPNMPEWVGVFFGCLRAGLILVPLDVRSAPDFVAKVKEQTDARCLFVSSRMRGQVPEIDIPQCTIEELRQEIEGVSPDSAPPLPAEDDIAEIIFTSGTTGEPKGVILTHHNIASNVLSATQVTPIKPRSRILSLLPLSHMLEQTAGLLLFLKNGATVVYPASRQPGLLFRTIREQHITHIVLVPQVLQLFGNAIERQIKKDGTEKTWQKALRLSTHLPMGMRKLLFRRLHRKLGGCIDFFICGGAYLDPELARRWELLGVPIIQGYGTTEASPIVCSNSMKDRTMDSLGKVLPGQAMKTAGDGEILIRGVNVTPGYWRNAEATRLAFEGDWYKTGDLGYIDDQGHLHFQGRKKDMIALSSGMKVYAQDVEEKVKSLPEVADACVIGAPGKGGSVHVHCVLVLKDPDSRPERIVETANSNLADHQRIQGFSVWPFPDLPRTPTLKVKKHEVLDYVLKGKAAPATTGSPQRGESTGVPALYRLVASITGVPASEVRTDMSLGNDLNLDSLGRVELLAGIEAEMDVYVDESVVSACTTLGDLQRLVESAGSTRVEQQFAGWSFNRFAGTARTVLQSVFLFPCLRLVTPLRVDGRENLKEIQGPALFIANHQSHLDTPGVLAALPVKWRVRTAVAAAADFWFTGSRARSLLATLMFNAFPFSRTDSIRPALEYCSQLLDRGQSVLIYPEGTRSLTGDMGAFKSGAGLMAVELGVPVVPVDIKGTFEVLPKGRAFPGRGRIRIRFGKPIRFRGNVPYAEAVRRMEEAITELKTQN